MKALQPVLFICSDAPPLLVPPVTAGVIQTAHFAHVQSNYLDKLGQTFSLLPGIVWRGKQTQNAYMGASGLNAQFSVFKELDAEGVVDAGDTELAIYVQIWGPQDNINGTGMCDSRWWYPTRTPYAPRFADPPSCVRDLLGMKTWGGMWNKYGSWPLQAKGRIWHEIAHHRTGEVAEWWNYPDIKPTPEQITALKGSPWLWVR